MPIEDFNAETFVAFTDISGFKRMMSNGDAALQALHHFYSTGYSILGQGNVLDRPRPEGLFISDCAILFMREQGTLEERLDELLTAISALNRALLPHKVMLTTSIAYGHFSYHQRIEFQGIDKTPIYGQAYLTAFLDASSTKHPLRCGECRIVKRNLPPEILQAIELGTSPFTRVRPKGGEHFYFYWMRDNLEDIEKFEKRYSNIDDIKFEGIRRLLLDEF